VHQLFIDQNIRIEVAEALREDGYQVIHASDANLDRRDDEEILRFARALGLMLSSKRTMVRARAGRTGDTAASAVPLYVFTGDTSGGAEEEERRRTEDACAERQAAKKVASAMAMWLQTRPVQLCFPATISNLKGPERSSPRVATIPPLRDRRPTAAPTSAAMNAPPAYVANPETRRLC
jgi:hypothetical protein